MATGTSFVMMALGDFRFGLDTAAYQDLSRTNSWRWPSVERIGARPALQFVGPGEESISMSGQIYPHFRGGLGQISAMRAEADKGEPLLLVDGTGQVWGKYVITDIREGQKVFFSNGAPRVQDFDITLQAYGGEEEAGTPLVATPPTLPTPSMEAAVSSYDGKDPAAFTSRIAAKSVITKPNLRELVGIDTSGIAKVANAISTAGSIFGAVSGAVSGMKRAAVSVPAALDSLLSSPSFSTFNAFGRDLNAIVAEARAAGNAPLDAVLDAVNDMGADSVAGRLFADNDQRAAFLALAEVRANG